MNRPQLIAQIYLNASIVHLQVLSIWTIFTSGFDIYCLHEATPGSSHTGYYIISFDFVYVGNWDGKL